MPLNHSICHGCSQKSFDFKKIISKHTIFHYNKLKLQQNDIKTKRYKRLKFKQRLQSMKNSVKQTKKWTRKTIDKMKTRKTKNQNKRNKAKETHTKQNKRKGKRESEKKNYVVSLAMSCYWILGLLNILLPYCFYFALGADLK